MIARFLKVLLLLVALPAGAITFPDAPSASIAIELDPEPRIWVILGYPPLSTAIEVTLSDIHAEVAPYHFRRPVGVERQKR